MGRYNYNINFNFNFNLKNPFLSIVYTQLYTEEYKQFGSFELIILYYTPFEDISM